MSVLTDSPEQPPNEPASYCAELGGLLRDLRALRGMPLRKTAAAVGVSESTLSRYEVGARKPPLTVLVKITAFYEIPFFVLLLLFARATSPEAVLPKGEQAVLLWALLRYDEAMPPQVPSDETTAGDGSPRPPEDSANGADEGVSGDGDGLAVTCPTRHDGPFPLFEPVFRPVTPPETE
ncbi:helix-turn-helix domain-containing protein [Allokutzneria oryzae]|uniref:Helix-turn-helix domain-containing protein n=1 Tax=Allokutzneria oryzae TaxID=1378989 RepID=A0ABV6A5P1_9PSEU